jgi:hypothetical protein
MGRLACLVLTLSIVAGDGLDGETGMPCSDIIDRGRGWIRCGRLTCLVLTLSIVGGDGLDGETGMPCSDIIYRGRGWIRWGDWHALF